MSENQNVPAVVEQKKSKVNAASWVAVASALAITAAMPVASNAALAEIGADLTSELDAGKLIIVAVMTLGATLLAMFAGYRYMKRGANSA